MRHTFAIGILLLALACTPAQSQEGIVGSWRGTSLCVDKANFPACKDEQVIYDVLPKGSRRDTVTVRADKIVNGKREFMGELEFSLLPDSSWVAHYENPRVKSRFVIRVRDTHMTGFLMDEIAGQRVREVALDRVKNE